MAHRRHGQANACEERTEVLVGIPVCQIPLPYASIVTASTNRAGGQPSYGRSRHDGKPRVRNRSGQRKPKAESGPGWIRATLVIRRHICSLRWGPLRDSTQARHEMPSPRCARATANDFGVYCNRDLQPRHGPADCDHVASVREKGRSRLSICGEFVAEAADPNRPSGMLSRAEGPWWRPSRPHPR